MAVSTNRPVSGRGSRARRPAPRRGGRLTRRQRWDGRRLVVELGRWGHPPTIRAGAGEVPVGPRCHWPVPRGRAPWPRWRHGDDRDGARGLQRAVGPNELHHRWLPTLRDGLRARRRRGRRRRRRGLLLRRPLPPRPESPDQPTRRPVCVADLFTRRSATTAPTFWRRRRAGDVRPHRRPAVTMTTQPDLRDRAQERLRAVIGPDTRIVIAHCSARSCRTGRCARTRTGTSTPFTPRLAPRLAHGHRPGARAGDDGLCRLGLPAEHWSTWRRSGTTPAPTRLAEVPGRGW